MLLMTNATLGFIEEMNAQASIAALKDGLVLKLPIKRDGTFVPMDIAELVPGDIVFLRGGNVVPADGMWVEGDELSVDQVRVWMRMLCVCRRMLCADAAGDAEWRACAAAAAAFDATALVLTTTHPFPSLCSYAPPLSLWMDLCRCLCLVHCRRH